MKLWYRILLILFIVFIGGLFYWALYAPKPEISERIYKTLKEQEKRADFSFKDVTFEEVVAGVKYWELSAKTAMVNKSTSISTLKEAYGTFFKEGKSVLRFKSPAALWDMKKKEILLDKPLGYNTALESKITALLASSKKNRSSIFNLPRTREKDSGYWFQANNLSWKLANQRLLCTGGIVLNKGEVTGYAERLEGDVSFERAILEGNPRMVIKPENNCPITLEASVFEVVGNKNYITAHGHPQILWKEAKISANHLKYLQDKEILRLSGKVKIIYKDIQAQGNSANYLTQTGRVDLEGAAYAKQGKNELSGKQVSVSLKEQKISIAGKGKVVISEEDKEEK